MSAVPASVVVLDTNVVLDVFVFDDAAAKPLRAALDNGTVQWLATPAMRTELARVLTYAHLVPRLAFYQLTAEDVLAQFDHHAQIVAAAPRTSAICKDPDDQIFIDLAVAHSALLLSKDNAVLCMKKRLLALGVVVKVAMDLVATA